MIELPEYGKVKRNPTQKSIEEYAIEPEADIPRGGITSRLSTNVVTYVGRKENEVAKLSDIKWNIFRAHYVMVGFYLFGRI